MLFNKEYYYNYIKSYESFIFIKFILIIIGFTILGFFVSDFLNFEQLKFSIISMLIGIFIGYNFYNDDKFKIEEMKMKLDLYNKIMNSDNIHKI